VALNVDLDFQRYVERRKGALEAQVREGAAYAYGADLRVKKTLDSLRPVRLAIEASVRLWKTWARAELLGTAVKVSPQQFPKIDALVEQAAKGLHIPRPTVYISSQIGELNAHTFGTDEDAYIVLHAALVDHLTESELLFVIGHECGHIQNNHVVLTTSLYYLMNAANRFVKWVVTPATLALSAWSRRAEITCDRAGLICARNLDTAEAVMLKLALGSKKLYQDLNVEAFLDQLRQDREHKGAPGGLAERVGTLTELFHDHPYAPKRIEALRIFAESAYYKALLGATGGLTQAEVDGKVGEVLSR
jgi:Zn-dependent protease with chaperone function